MAMILERKDAIAKQAAVNIMAHDGLADWLDPLHRLELILNDDLGFDFRLAEFGVHEYRFMHNVCLDLSRTSLLEDRSVTIPQLINILETVRVALVEMDEKDLTSISPDALAVARKLPLKHQLFCLSIPQTIGNSIPFEHATLGGRDPNMYAVEMLQDWIDFLEYGNNLLLKKGFGDRP